MMRRALLSAYRPACRLLEDLLPRSCSVFASAMLRRGVARLALSLSLAVTASFVGLVVTEPARADSEIVSYDPSQCATDPEGTVTIALDRLVMRVPMDALSSIRDLPPEARAVAPAPPDPSEPEGCPDHPMVGRSFYFRYLSDTLHNNSSLSSPAQRRIDRLLLVAARPDFWGLQPSEERSFERICNDQQIRDELDNGLLACLVRPDITGRPREHWPFAAQAPLDLYTAPFGRPFMVHCTWGFRPGTHQCDVTYKLYETVNVSYRFEPGRLPLDDLIDFDRGLRASIESMRIHDFVWPDERSANGDGA